MMACSVSTHAYLAFLLCFYFVFKNCFRRTHTWIDKCISNHLNNRFESFEFGLHSQSRLIGFFEVGTENIMLLQEMNTLSKINWWLAHHSLCKQERDLSLHLSWFMANISQSGMFLTWIYLCNRNMLQKFLMLTSFLHLDHLQGPLMFDISFFWISYFMQQTRCNS